MASVALQQYTRGASESEPGLHLRWSEVNAAVIKAQIVYAELLAEPEPGPDAATIDAAWLRLWRLQEMERELGRELDDLET